MCVRTVGGRSETGMGSSAGGVEREIARAFDQCEEGVFDEYC